ncbi:plasmid maintenance protein [Cryptosporidium andersoni]|uniref:Mannosyltransferase n=1 Tax=Cryptosporidium andersoni TaxID=117008 RepID=A0A1J4MUD7_9CRYT|nr:plasmid maintenance protein [Cryptosporidium andersoni]
MKSYSFFKFSKKYILYHRQWFYFTLVSFRIINSLLIKTTFNPDEYWQSLEVAYQIVFGYGFLTWEWDHCIALRSIIYPLLFALIYKIFNIINISNTIFIIYIPRLFQAFFAFLTDIGTAKFTFLLTSKLKIKIFEIPSTIYNMDLIALSLSIFSWFNFFCLCRTYSQTLECCLNIWSMYFLLLSILPEKNLNINKNEFFTLILSSISVLIRHSSVIFWFLIFFFYSIHIILKYSYCRFYYFLLKSFIIVSISIIIMISADWWFYGKFVLPMINFFNFNLLGNPGVFFGNNSWHYYFLECPISLLLSYIPFFILGLYCILFNQNKKLKFISKFQAILLSIFLVIILLSFSSHKEYRFILPYFPFLIVTTTIGIYYCINRYFSKKYNYSYIKIIILIIIIFQLIPAIYFSLLHQRGGESVIKVILSLPNISNSSIFFISQCHMYPFYSYIYKPIQMGFFDCSPINNAQNWNSRLWYSNNITSFLDSVFISNHFNQFNYSNCISPYIIPKLSKKNIYTGWFHNEITTIKNVNDSCLHYRFLKKICGPFPTYFIVHSSFINDIKNWLNLNNYIQLGQPIFDSIITETPKGYITYSYYYIYKKNN